MGNAKDWETVSAGLVSVMIEALRRISGVGPVRSGSIIAAAWIRVRSRECDSGDAEVSPSSTNESLRNAGRRSDARAIR
jgi:hypothetical protein